MFIGGVIQAYTRNWPMPATTPDKKLNFSARMSVGLILCDTILSISSLVIGTLGLVGVLPGLRPAAAYTWIGVSGLITLSWTALALLTNGQVFPATKNLLLAAVSSNPEQYISRFEADEED